MNTRKAVSTIILITLIFALLFSVGSCKRKAPAGEDAATTTAPVDIAGKIGISMPSGSHRASFEGALLKKMLESQGHTLDLRYAEDVTAQFQQIEDLLREGCELLIIKAVNEYALGNALETAKQSRVPVIALDKLIMGTDAVSSFIAFDDTKSGVLQGEYIIEQLKPDASAEPINIEIFPGDLDSGDVYYFNGLVTSLESYLDNGKIVIKSGMSSPGQSSVSETDPSEAKNRMLGLLGGAGDVSGGAGLYGADYAVGGEGADATEYASDGGGLVVADNALGGGGFGATDYASDGGGLVGADSASGGAGSGAMGYAPGGKLDAIFCKNDIIAQGVIAALLESGYTKENFPLITGQNCESDNVKYMVEGFQAMSLYPDADILGFSAVNAVKAFLTGTDPESNAVVNNGAADIPAMLLEPVICTADNYRELLLDSGFYESDPAL